MTAAGGRPGLRGAPLPGRPGSLGAARRPPGPRIAGCGRF